MTRTALILLIAAFAAIVCCGNDPRVIDAYVKPPPDGSGSMVLMCTGSNPAWLQDCNSSATCMGCTCQMFGHQMYCTKMCTGSADCPAPATQCFMGMCAK